MSSGSTEVLCNGVLHEKDNEHIEDSLSDLLLEHQFDQLDDILRCAPDRIYELTSAILEAACDRDLDVLMFVSNYLLPKEVFCFVLFDKDLLDWFLEDEEDDIYEYFTANELLDEYLSEFGTDDFDSPYDLIHYLYQLELLDEIEFEELCSRYCIEDSEVYDTSTTDDAPVTNDIPIVTQESPVD